MTAAICEFQMSIESSPGEVPTFYPTYDEFKDFSKFISSIEARGVHRIGLAKIVPPKEWKARRSGYKLKQIGDRIVENPIKQEVHGRDGVYSVFNIQQKSVKVNSFQKMANSNRYAPPSALSNEYEKLERKYWQSFTSTAPIYGADVSGSLYDEDQQIWNVNNLGTILDDLSTEYGMKIQGVNTAYLYYGMWRASFAWHTEDMDLYSINYLHFGAPKQWYVIPPSYGRKFEELASSRFPSLARRCPAFLRHKMTIVAPSILTKNSIPYSKIIQNEGEFIITFPYGYHAGFNYGFNCAESTNFALERWIEYGKHSIKCTCREDMVKISMDCFVMKYQPELYESWSRGINLTPHPEDQNAVQGVQMKKRCSSIVISTTIIDETTNSFTTQQQHQQRITDERYNSIFRNLINFDKMYSFLIDRYPTPLLRAAVGRVQFKIPTTRCKTLLSILVKKLSKIPTENFHLKIFNGLKQSANYRQEILNGLWNFQSLDVEAERRFNRYLKSQWLTCSICYLLTGNKIKENLLIGSSSIIDQLCSDSQTDNDDLLECSNCSVCVHRQCYENVCLAMNIQLDDEYEPWLCQRCILSRNSNIDDRCSSCSIRSGLLLFDNRHEKFQHAICSIYENYQPEKENQISCQYCWSFSPVGYRKISTNLYASCQHPKCSIHFHITCGLVSGCVFSFDSKEKIFNAHCHLHASSCLPTILPSFTRHRSATIDGSDDEQSSLLVDDIIDEKDRLSNGVRVIVDGKIGEIVGNEVIYHYSVDFGDETFSHDMLAEDILDSNLTVGEKIRVKWTDGTIYPCKYLGRKRVLLYRIELDQEIRQLQRNEFSLDSRTRPPSPPPTPPRSSDFEKNSIRTATKSKRDQSKGSVKRKRCRRLLSSSSSSSSSTE